MKPGNFLVAAAMLGFAACSSPYRATDSTVVVAPVGVQTAFTTQYPSATNVVWTSYDATVVPIDRELAGWSTLDEGDYLVRFDMSDEPYYAWYDENGDWIGTVYVVRDPASLPGPVTQTLNNQYPGYGISSVHREFQKDKMLYEIELKNTDNEVKLLVDGNGNIVKQKTKTK